jgi:hypothetical protein
VLTDFHHVISHLADLLSERVSAVIDEFLDVLTPNLGRTTTYYYLSEIDVVSLEKRDAK